MGYYIPDPKFPSCRNYEPDDTDGCFYLKDGATITEILETAKEKWPDGWSDLQILPEYIHCYAIGYDVYDAGDYENFLCITRII